MGYRQCVLCLSCYTDSVAMCCGRMTVMCEERRSSERVIADKRVYSHWSNHCRYATYPTAHFVGSMHSSCDGYVRRPGQRLECECPCHEHESGLVAEARRRG